MSISPPSVAPLMDQRSAKIGFQNLDQSIVIASILETPFPGLYYIDLTSQNKNENLIASGNDIPLAYNVSTDVCYLKGFNEVHYYDVNSSVDVTINSDNFVKPSIAVIDDFIFYVKRICDDITSLDMDLYCYQISTGQTQLVYDGDVGELIELSYSPHGSVQSFTVSDYSDFFNPSDSLMAYDPINDVISTITRNKDHILCYSCNVDGDDIVWIENKTTVRISQNSCTPNQILSTVVDNTNRSCASRRDARVESGIIVWSEWNFNPNGADIYGFSY